MTEEFRIVDPRSEDAVLAMSSYFAELNERFIGGFDPGDALVTDAPRMEGPTGAFVVVYVDGSPAGCGGIQTIDAGVGEIKRMWVDGAHRGAGLGRRLLAELEAVAGALGHRAVRLDTNRVLLEAVAMYRRAGYAEIERYADNPYAHHWFEKRLG